MEIHMSGTLNTNLPKWDLTDLYASLSDVQIERDITTITQKAKVLEDSYKGKISSLDGDTWFDIIVAYETISEKMGKIMSYAGLYYATHSTDMTVGAFYQTSMERITLASSYLLFFSLEINKIDEDTFNTIMEKSDKIKFYQSWLKDGRKGRQYQLSDDVENALHEKASCGRSAWVRLFDQTMAGLVFTVDGEDMNESALLNLMSHKDSTVREKATREMGRVLNANMPTLQLITNTLAKDKEVSDRLRGFATPMSSRNLSNMVEDEVVEALVSSVKGQYKNISHRYYKLKAKWLGVEKLKLWDRNAPLPQGNNDIVQYDDAVTLVLSAYKDFSPKLYDVAKDFFDNSWIDVGVYDGKRSGAFAHPCVPSVHPYLLLNFQGKTRDVMTLAHELGHGCHQVLASKQGYFKSQTPLTLAETASVFAEMLTFRKILNMEQDKEQRRILLAGKVEDMINTVVRQIAFLDFERMVHEGRKSGELSTEQLGEFWMKASKESLGEAFEYDDFYKDFWAYIPHFIHSPFYVYAYAFGDCLVNTIYAKYQSGMEDFDEKYLELLSAGGSKGHKKLLEPFGLDANDPGFWNEGLSVINGFIDELESTF